MRCGRTALGTRTRQLRGRGGSGTCPSSATMANETEDVMPVTFERFPSATSAVSLRSCARPTASFERARVEHPGLLPVPPMSSQGITAPTRTVAVVPNRSQSRPVCRHRSRSRCPILARHQKWHRHVEGSVSQPFRTAMRYTPSPTRLPKRSCPNPGPRARPTRRIGSLMLPATRLAVAPSRAKDSLHARPKSCRTPPSSSTAYSAIPHRSRIR